MARRSRPYPGLFVVLEGLDGAGTTTQCERLCAALRAEGYRASVTRQPSDGPIGTLIRQALTRRLVLPGGAPLGPQTLALLFAADRVDHLEAQILPALQRGEIVLCDRYLLSSLAYQGASLPMDWVADVNAFATVPDLTLFLAVEVEVAAARRAGRGANAELFEDDDQQARIARQYERALRRATPVRKTGAPRGAGKLVRLDGTAPPQEVTRRALEALRPLLRRAG